MRKLVLLFVALAACGASPVLAAKGDSWVALQVGGAVPTSDLGQTVGPGFEGGLEYQYMDSEYSGVGLTVAYHAWGQLASASLPSLPFIGQAYDYRLHAIETTAHALVELPGGEALTPHLRVGAGLYWLQSRIQIFGSDIRDSEYHLGYNVGLGALVGPPSTDGVGFDGTLHLIQGSRGEWAKALTFAMTVRLGMAGRR